jgi:hypothetical protein
MVSGQYLFMLLKMLSANLLSYAVHIFPKQLNIITIFMYIEVLKMKKIVVLLIALAVLGIFYGVVAEADADGGGDENYHDQSEENSSGPGEPPEDGQARDESRTRAKDC